jgi:hypothetical protein
MTREEAKLSWITYVMDNETRGKLERQTVINMFDFIDEVAEELQSIIYSKEAEIEAIHKEYANRTCESCEWFIENQAGVEGWNQCNELAQVVKKDFCCNRWKTKEK